MLWAAPQNNQASGSYFIWRSRDISFRRLSVPVWSILKYEKEKQFMLQAGRSINYTVGGQKEQKKKKKPICLLNFVRRSLFANYFLANDEIDRNNHLAFGRI